MKASEFKTEIKRIKEILKGMRIQFVTKNSVMPYTSLREFGNSVLEQESRGNDFRISRAWTNEGSEVINTFEQFMELFNTKNLTCVTFEAYYEPKDFADYLRNGFTLND